MEFLKQLFGWLFSWLLDSGDPKDDHGYDDEYDLL